MSYGVSTVRPMLSLLLPVRCPVCGGAGTAPCPGCAAALHRAPGLPPVAGTDSCSAFLDYNGAGRELVARLKYRNARSSLPFLARGMAALVSPHDVDVVTWAPTTAERRRRRGFDQAELLAREVARRLGRPCRGLLSRNGGPPQTGRPLDERRRGPSFSSLTPPGNRVLLVDDVVTSGATVSSAARVLRNAGANTVRVVAAARTPPPRDRY